jgi:hypothetical protein
MKNDIPLYFDRSAIIIGMGNPDKESLCAFCVTEEASGFTTGVKFVRVIGEYACHTFCTEGAEMGEIWMMLEPKKEGGYAG